MSFRNFPYPKMYETGRVLSETPILSWLTGGFGNYLQNIGMGAKNDYFDYLAAGDVVPTPSAKALPVLAGALKGVKPGKWLSGFYHGSKYGKTKELLEKGLTTGASSEIGLEGSSLAKDPLVSYKLFSAPGGSLDDVKEISSVLRVFPKGKAEDVYNLPPDVYHSGVVPGDNKPVFYGKPNQAFKESEVFATRKSAEDPELFNAVESVYERSSDLSWRQNQLEAKMWEMERGNYFSNASDPYAPSLLVIPEDKRPEYNRLKSQHAQLEKERLTLFKASQKAHEKLKDKLMLKPDVNIRELTPKERHRIQADDRHYENLTWLATEDNSVVDNLSQGELMQTRRAILDSLDSLRGNQAYRVRFFSNKHDALSPNRTQIFFRDHGVDEKTIYEFKTAYKGLEKTKSALQRAVSNAKTVEFDLVGHHSPASASLPDPGLPVDLDAIDDLDYIPEDFPVKRARTLAERVQNPTPQAKVARKLYREFYNKLDKVEQSYRKGWMELKPTTGLHSSEKLPVKDKDFPDTIFDLDY